MTAPARLERDLPSILGDLAMGPSPDYIDDVLGQTGRIRQRPGWTFPERWLPMADITNRQAVAPRVPFRAIGVALVVLALLATAAFVYIGSRPKLPAPFGVAANGLIAFADVTGAIQTVDAVTGRSTVIIPAAGYERPVFSPDGTRLAVLKKTAGGAYDVVVTDAAGGNPKVISSEPLPTIDYLGWSPDSTSVVATVPPGRIMLFDASGGAAPRRVDRPGRIADPDDGRRVQPYRGEPIPTTERR